MKEYIKYLWRKIFKPRTKLRLGSEVVLLFGGDCGIYGKVKAFIIEAPENRARRIRIDIEEMG